VDADLADVVDRLSGQRPAAGLWPNAVLNSVFAVAFAVPLIATRSCFGSSLARTA
jgi:hypothetical protein